MTIQDFINYVEKNNIDKNMTLTIAGGWCEFEFIEIKKLEMRLDKEDGKQKIVIWPND